MDYKSEVTILVRQMLKDLNKHHRDSKDLKLNYIKLRLNKSLNSYYKDLLASFKSLSRKEAITVLKKMIKVEER